MLPETEPLRDQLNREPSLRSQRQLDFERTISQTFGKTLGQRLWLIRDAIFRDLPSDQPHHQPPETTETLEALQAGQLVSANRAEIKNQFTPFTENATQAAAALASLIDAEADRIRALPSDEEKEPAAWRLAAVILTSGILIQPRNDGNKQTFRLIALSYIHDLLPNERTNFFPILEGPGVHVGLDPTVPMLAPIGVKPEHKILETTIPKIEGTNDQERQLLQLADQIREGLYLLVRDSTWRQFKSFKVAVSQTIEKNLDRLNALLETKYQISKKTLESKVFSLAGVTLKIPTLRGYDQQSVQRAVIAHFKAASYPIEVIRSTITPIALGQIDRASWVVTQLFGMNEGLELIQNYITGDVTADSYENANSTYQKALHLFEAHIIQMRQVMETEADHFQDNSK